MKPFSVPLTACAVVLCGLTSAGQSAPTMNEEPHHKRLTYVRHMRVFEINVAPGDMTLDHLHDHDVISLTLGSFTVRTRRMGEDWTAPQMRTAGQHSMTQYTGTPTVHQLENVGTTPYRVLLIENLRDSGWTAPRPLDAPGTTLRDQSRSFAVYDMRLNAATPRTMHTHQNPSFIFLMSGSVQAQGGGGEFAFPLDQARTWWFPGSGPDQPHTIELADGSSEAHVICVEAK